MEIRPGVREKLPDLPVTLQLMELLNLLYCLYQLCYLPARHCVIVVVNISSLLCYLSEPRLGSVASG